MPVRYDIAAQVPQAATGGMDPLNAFATMQAMSYRQQQNALAQMQMQEYQRKLQAEQALRGLSTGAGFNIADPSLVGRTFAIDPDQAVKIANLQRQLEAMQASTEAQRAAAGEASARTQLARREFEEIKLPRAELEKQKLGIETEKLGLEKEEAGLRGRKLQQDIRKFEEVEMPKAFSELEKARNDQKISNQEFLAKKAGYYRDYFKDFVTNQTTLDRLVDLMDQDKDFPAGGSAFRGVKFTPEWKASQLISPEKQAELAKPKFNYQQVTDAAGNTRIVAIPEGAPERGAIAVPGSEGVKARNLTAMPGPPETGTVIVFDPVSGRSRVTTPDQPNAMAAPAAPANAMVAPPQATPAAAPVQGRMIPAEIRPTAEAPVGSAAYNNKRFATEVLDAAGFNAETGKDEVSELIRKSTSGGMEAGGAGIRGFFGVSSPGMENIAKLETIKNDIVLKKLAGKLGAGISEGDRQFIEKLTGDIANPNIPANQRLAAWNQVKGLMVKYANTGQPMTAPTGAPAGRPSLDEIFK